MIGYVYGPGQKLTANQDLGLKVATPVGTLVGQLLFGWLADVVGRKRMCTSSTTIHYPLSHYPTIIHILTTYHTDGVELMIIIIATFGQALAGNAHAVNIFGVLIVWRFIMGIGIGGDYPLSAVISSEFASTHIRGRLMTAVFAFQGWGNFTAALVALVITAAFKSALLADNPATLNHVDNMWRILIGLGCLPGTVALYYRLTIPETPRFTMDIERNVQQASEDVDNFLTSGTFYVDPDAVVQRVDAPKASRADFARHFGQWKNLKILLGCAWSWFALDIAFYGLGLNSSIVLTAIGFNGGGNYTGTLKVYENLKNIAIGNLIISAAGLIPGYWVTFLFVDSWGRKPIQLMGFIMLTIIFVIMGFAYDKLTATTAATNAFVFLYCLANFFQNFGTYHPFCVAIAYDIDTRLQDPTPQPSSFPARLSRLVTAPPHTVSPPRLASSVRSLPRSGSRNSRTSVAPTSLSSTFSRFSPCSC